MTTAASRSMSRGRSSKFNLRSVVIPCVLLLMQNLIGRAVAMTTTQQQELVDIHNALRRGEGSSNMQIMTWDSSLAVMAQSWSDHCDFSHGQNYNSSTLSNLNMGQNIYLTSTSTINLTAAVLSWFNEKADYTYSSNTCGTSKVCGHYTQVVWARSKLVGCGFTTCATVTSSTITSGTLLVCNYGPAGNMQGETPYMVGAACTQCASGQLYCNNGLCDTVADETSSASSSSSSTSTPGSTTSTTAPLPKPKLDACLIATKSGISLRRKPEVKKSTIDTVKSGDAYRYLGQKTKTGDGTLWLKVKSVTGRSLTGWIKAEYLSEKTSGKCN